MNIYIYIHIIWVYIQLFICEYIWWLWWLYIYIYIYIYIIIIIFKTTNPIPRQQQKSFRTVLAMIHPKLVASLACSGLLTLLVELNKLNLAFLRFICLYMFIFYHYIISSYHYFFWIVLVQFTCRVTSQTPFWSGPATYDYHRLLTLPQATVATTWGRRCSTTLACCDHSRCLNMEKKAQRVSPTARDKNRCQTRNEWSMFIAPPFLL